MGGNAGVALVSDRRFQVDPEDYSWIGDEADERSSGHRPRTKKRPEHKDATPGLVIAVDRGRYRVHPDGSAETEAVVTTRARELRKDSIVVGDRVDVVGDVSGDEGTLGRIVRIHPRTTILRRSADDSDTVERVIVANVDQLVMVVAAADPEPRPRLIDRYLVAAFDQGIDPLLVITKVDLADPTPLIDYVAPLGVRCIAVSPESENGLDELRDALVGKTSVLVGHSGVGKSTLVNRLVPGTDRAVGDVNVHTGRGRHTSSSSVGLPIGGGWIIDTPGVRSFGLGHVSRDTIEKAFVDLEPFLSGCPKACSHGWDQPDCGVTIAARDNILDPRLEARATSLRLLLGHPRDVDHETGL